MTDIFVLFHASTGKGTVLNFPISTMADEFHEHQIMFPESDPTAEMFRRLQVRAVSTIQNMFLGHGEHETIFPRNYFVSHGITESEADSPYEIDILTTDKIFYREFQVMMYCSQDDMPELDFFRSPDDPTADLFPHSPHSMTIPDFWASLSEVEKEAEWQAQLVEVFLQRYVRESLHDGIKAEAERVSKRSLPKHIVELLLKQEQQSCMICYEDLEIENAFVTHCGHCLCKSCEHILFYQNNHDCPMCRAHY